MSETQSSFCNFFFFRFSELFIEVKHIYRKVYKSELYSSVNFFSNCCFIFFYLAQWIFTKQTHPCNRQPRSRKNTTSTLSSPFLPLSFCQCWRSNLPVFELYVNGSYFSKLKVEAFHLSLCPLLVARLTRCQLVVELIHMQRVQII